MAHDARPLLAYEEHVAAVKAIAWSPHHHGLLASGGGTADRCIKFWNTLSGQPLRSIETESQVRHSSLLTVVKSLFSSIMGVVTILIAILHLT